MSSAIYASLSALLIVALSLRVIKVRRRKKISLGDGGDDELMAAIGAQSNAIEYIPITLLLLFALEVNDANIFALHAFGIALITSRLIHAQGMLIGNIKARVLGMQITFFIIIALALMNIAYLPYKTLFYL